APLRFKPGANRKTNHQGWSEVAAQNHRWRARGDMHRRRYQARRRLAADLPVRGFVAKTDAGREPFERLAQDRPAAWTIRKARSLREHNSEGHGAGRICRLRRTRYKESPAAGHVGSYPQR